MFWVVAHIAARSNQPSAITLVIWGSEVEVPVQVTPYCHLAFNEASYVLIYCYTYLECVYMFTTHK